MLVFTVHESPAAPADRLDRAEAIVFIRDGFSLGAALLGPCWLLVNGLWLAAIIAIAAGTLAGFILFAIGAGIAWYAALLATLHIVIGFEGRNIERWTLARRGWSMLGSVSGRDVEECERRFFEAWLPRQPFIRQAGLAGAAGSLREPLGGAGLGERSQRRPIWQRLLRRS